MNQARPSNAPDAVEAADRPGAAGPVEDAVRLLGRAPVRVLLVEADETDGRLTQGLLNAAPHLVFAVDRARELEAALARVRAGSFDVCLIDPALPDGDGLEVVRAARDAAAARRSSCCRGAPRSSWTFRRWCSA